MKQWLMAALVASAVAMESQPVGSCEDACFGTYNHCLENCKPDGQHCINRCEAKREICGHGCLEGKNKKKN